jgi:anaphase-promoting complex subunit 6
MEQMMLSHLIHADEALTAAHAMCDVDPLLINERGVLKFYNKEYIIFRFVLGFADSGF